MQRQTQTLLHKTLLNSLNAQTNARVAKTEYSLL